MWNLSKKERDRFGGVYVLWTGRQGGASDLKNADPSKIIFADHLNHPHSTPHGDQRLAEGQICESVELWQILWPSGPEVGGDIILIDLKSFPLSLSISDSGCQKIIFGLKLSLVT